MGAIEETYKNLKDLIDCTLASDKIHSLVVSSPPGLGKTYTVVEKMRSKGYEPLKDYLIISGYITALEFYKYIYDYSNKIIIVDDTDSVLQSEEIKGMLLAMLFNPLGARVVTYASSSSKLDDRNHSCEFTGKLILLTNTIPKHLKAYLSRSFFYRFDISRDKRIAMMYEMAETQAMPKEIVDFIKDNTSKETPSMDFRLLAKTHEIYTTKNDRWKILALALIRADDEITRAVVDLAESGMTVKEQEKKFIADKFGCRATFYRIRKMLGLAEEKSGKV